MENAGLALPSALLDIARQTPPLPSSVLSLSRNAEDLREFKALVHRYTPDQAQQVLTANTPAKQIQAFSGQFSKAYFPLATYIIEFYSETEATQEDTDRSIWDCFLEKVPLELHGIAFDELHALWEAHDEATTHLALLTGLPYEYNQPETSTHASWVETALASSVPAEIIQRIPEGGIHPAVLREALSGTKENDALLLMEWVLGTTNNLFMDYSQDDFDEGMISLHWDEETITDLTSEWNESQKIQEAISRTIDRMRDDPVNGLSEVLDFTLARMEAIDVAKTIKKWNNGYRTTEPSDEDDNPENGTQDEDNDNQEH